MQMVLCVSRSEQATRHTGLFKSLKIYNLNVHKYRISLYRSNANGIRLNTLQNYPANPYHFYVLRWNDTAHTVWYPFSQNKFQPHNKGKALPHRNTSFIASNSTRDTKIDYKQPHRFCGPPSAGMAISSEVCISASFWLIHVVIYMYVCIITN